MQSEASLCNFCNYRTGSNTKRGCKCSQRHGRKRPPSQALLPLLAPAEPPGSQWVLGPAPALDNGGLRLCLGLSASAEVPTPRSRPAHRSDAAAGQRGIVPGSCHVLPSPPPAIWPWSWTAYRQASSKAGRPCLQSGSPTTPHQLWPRLEARVQVTIIPRLDSQLLRSLPASTLAALQPLLGSQRRLLIVSQASPATTPSTFSPFTVKSELLTVVSETLPDLAPACL